MLYRLAYSLTYGGISSVRFPSHRCSLYQVAIKLVSTAGLRPHPLQIIYSAYVREGLTKPRLALNTVCN